MVWNNGETAIPEQTHGIGHNTGQHYAMNRLLDEAVAWGADWFIRIDEDAQFSSRDWLRRMLRIQHTHQKHWGRACVLSPTITGLRHPPKPFANVRVGKFYCDIVDVLGGICRMAPMSLMRYWRWDERMAMGFSEASTFARFCKQLTVAMLRAHGIDVAHGGSTDAQEAADSTWAAEHNMLQLVPYGL